ncbi:hypothetical protein SLA2020_398020 [Shorea laevis]
MGGCHMAVAPPVLPPVPPNSHMSRHWPRFRSPFLTNRGTLDMNTDSDGTGKITFGKSLWHRSLLPKTSTKALALVPLVLEAELR